MLPIRARRLVVRDAGMQQRGASPVRHLTLSHVAPENPSPSSGYFDLAAVSEVLFVIYYHCLTQALCDGVQIQEPHALIFEQDSHGYQDAGKALH